MEEWHRRRPALAISLVYLPRPVDIHISVCLRGTNLPVSATCLSRNAMSTIPTLVKEYILEQFRPMGKCLGWMVAVRHHDACNGFVTKSRVGKPLQCTRLTYRLRNYPIEGAASVRPTVRRDRLCDEKARSLGKQPTAWHLPHFKFCRNESMTKLQ